MLKFFILIAMLFSFTSHLHSKEGVDFKYKNLVDEVLPILNQVSSYPSFEYPLQEFEKLFQVYSHQNIPIFVYGSLINPFSAARSLSQGAIEQARPALAFGLKRLFNRNVAQTAYAKKKPYDTGSLNVEPTGDIGDIINGVVIFVDCHDLACLVQREEGYDLIPIPVMDWNEAFSNTSPKVFFAYTFSASTEPREGKVYVANDINPIEPYARIVLDGVQQWGEPFLKFWKATTYLADGKTPFSVWENDPDWDIRNSSNH